jgi:hypothetical protein
MMVTVPALTVSGLGNAQRVVSGVNTGSDVLDGGWAGPVWATASYNHAPHTTAASAIDTNDLMTFILSY